MGIRTLAIAGALAAALAAATPCRAQVEVSVSASFSDLNEYGEWIHVHGYGTVWRPDAEPGWRPFMYGRWVNSADGWLWDSDEPFGWIVCHYGNWYNDENLGWLWVPGYEWSPARVEWNVSSDEIAWAPLPPPMLAGRHQHAFRHAEWLFCPAPFFTAPELRAHVEVRAHAAVAGGARVHVYSSAPPRLDFVRSVVRAPVVTVTPNRVRVGGGEHPLVKVEVQSQARPQAVVPAGPRVRRITVRTQPQPSTKVRVTTDQNPRNRVEPAAVDANAQQPGGNPPSPRVRVESRTDRDADQNDDRGKDRANNNPRERGESQ